MGTEIIVRVIAAALFLVVLWSLDYRRKKAGKTNPE